MGCVSANCKNVMSEERNGADAAAAARVVGFETAVKGVWGVSLVDLKHRCQIWGCACLPGQPALSTAGLAIIIVFVLAGWQSGNLPSSRRWKEQHSYHPPDQTPQFTHSPTPRLNFSEAPVQQQQHQTTINNSTSHVFISARQLFNATTRKAGGGRRPRPPVNSCAAQRLLATTNQWTPSQSKALSASTAASLCVPRSSKKSCMLSSAWPK